jgi:ribonuclease-3
VQLVQFKIGNRKSKIRMLPEFNDASLLARALTHSSYANEHLNDETPAADNERLEFLGDAVLDFIAGAWLYDRFSDYDEGRLTSVRAALVRVSTLADFARQCGLPEHLRLGKGEIDTGGRNRANILGDAFEALLGALYLDQGFEAVRTFLLPFFERATPDIVNDNLDRDAKSRLQEWAQGKLNKTPRYRLISTEGPDHAKIFNVGVWLGEKLAGTGTGTSKQLAEQLAAKEALTHAPEFEAANSSATPLDAPDEPNQRTAA